MAKWVGVFVNNLDGKSVREVEVEADDEVTAIMLLDLYDYDETWQQYSFVEMQKKVPHLAAKNSSLEKELKQPFCMPLVHAYTKSVVTTLACVHCFSCFCFDKSPFYYGQSPEFQVNCKNNLHSKHQENTYRYPLAGTIPLRANILP